jgi:hypothetical protein
MTDECLHKCEFDLDMDGQITCVICGVRNPTSWGQLPPTEFEE